MDDRFNQFATNRREYSVEASDLRPEGFTPGQWPFNFTDSVGNEWVKDGWDGNRQAMVYSSGDFELVVFND